MRYRLCLYLILNIRKQKKANVSSSTKTPMPCDKPTKKPVCEPGMAVPIIMKKNITASSTLTTLVILTTSNNWRGVVIRTGTLRRLGV